MNTGNLVYGYGKYKVIITTPNNVYISYFNNLDSKYGTTINGVTYGYDFIYDFISENQPVEFRGNGNHIDDVYPYIPGYPIKEFKVWKIIQPVQEEPRGTEFYARTTPFGYRPDINNTYRESVSIGTRIILDHVYKYSSTSKCGYNTTTYPVDYFNNPYAYIPENDTGYTYLTPSYLFTNGNQEYYGIEFYADPGCIMELKNNIKFWISAMTENVNGDKLRLKIGSKIIMGNGAKIQTYFTGKYIDEGSIKELSSGTVFRAWQHSSFELTGNNVIHTYNNSANMVIDGGATLKVGDNTTVIFDGENSKLQLKPQSIVQLGENAKIKFTNGAYLDANGATFSSLGSSPWQGIEFENAGSQTSVTNCTFNNVISPIKIINNEEHAYYDKIFINNIFNVPSSGLNSVIYAENLLNATFQNNQFNMASNSISVGLFIKNYYTHETPRIIITGNVFLNGNCSIILSDYTAAEINYYISNNNFKLNSGGFNIITRMMTGDIKNNISDNNNPNYNIHLNQSNPNIYRNSLNANFTNLFVATNSYPLLSSVQYSDDQLIAVGGGNNFTINNVENSRNIFFNDGYAYLDYGNNNFTKINSTSYHLEGAVTMTRGCLLC